MICAVPFFPNTASSPIYFQKFVLVIVVQFLIKFKAFQSQKNDLAKTEINFKDTKQDRNLDQFKNRSYVHLSIKKSINLIRFLP